MLIRSFVTDGRNVVGVSGPGAAPLPGPLTIGGQGHTDRRLPQLTGMVGPAGLALS